VKLEDVTTKLVDVLAFVFVLLLLVGLIGGVIAAVVWGIVAVAS